VAKREHYFFVCSNVRPEGSPRPSCGRAGAQEIYAALKAELNKRGLSKTVARVCTSSCLDMCDYGPVVVVQPENSFQLHMNLERTAAVVQAMVDGSLIEEPGHIAVCPEGTDKDR
jgi:(2Fe-2S) ferredoxin